MNHRLTASKVKLGRRCLWWARPDVELPASETSRAAELGTVFHEAAETEAEDEEGLRVDLLDGLFRGATREGSASVELSDKERAHLEALLSAWREWFAGAGLGAVATEVALSLAFKTHGTTGRTLTLEAPRAYASACFDCEVPGTADIVGTTAEGRLFVGDYKTGRGPHTLAEHRDQLATLAAAASLDRVEGANAEPVEVAVIHVTPDGVRVDSETLDPFDLAVHAAEVRDLHALIPTAEPSPGFHCEDMHCPARAVCPATRALLLDAKLGEGDRRRLPIVGPITSDEQARAVLVAESLVAAWIAERVAAAKIYADAVGGIKREDGAVFRGRELERETPKLEVKGALEALRSVFGEDVGKAYETKLACSLSGTIDSAAAAMKARLATESGRKVAKKHIVNDAREALRAVGALKVSKYTSYTWKKEKDEES
jgi:hypothetical protein